MIKLKGNALWTNKRKSFFIQSIANLPNSQPQGVIETNAVAGFQSRPDNFMSLIKIRSPGSSDNDKGNQTASCSLRGGVGGMGKEPGCPEPAGWGLLGAHLPLKRRALPTSEAQAPSLISSGATIPSSSGKIKHETPVWISKHSPLPTGSSALSDLWGTGLPWLVLVLWLKRGCRDEL